ncbi:MAG: DUF3352 domain-containing protein [Bacteroidota bacterium]
MKTVLKILLFVVLLGAAAIAGYIFIDTGEEVHNPLDLVPSDVIYAIESDRPVKDWQELSDSEVWRYLKGNEAFLEITEMADYLDSLLSANQKLVDAVRLGDMVISAHMTSREDYDFLIIVDLKGKGRKLAKLKPVVEETFSQLGYEVSSDEYFNLNVYNLYDPEYKDNLTISIVGNILVASYTEKLVRDAIIQSEKPSLLENPAFKQVRDRAERDELYTFYLNYDRLDEYLGIYTDGAPEMLGDLNNIIRYSAFDLLMDDDEIRMDGALKQTDSIGSYLTIYKDVGMGKSHIENVLPGHTAMYTSIGFDNFAELYQRFENQYQETDPEGYKTILTARNQLEKRLDIEFERDFFQWMTDEVVTAVVPLGENSNEYAYYALLHFDDLELTEERLDYVMKKIGKTLVKFKEYDYQGFDIRYLKLKGFFSLFFKKMFSEIDKPYFTYLDDYVVFSNDTTALHYLIDEYLQQNILRNKEDYDDFMDQFNSRYSIFTYMQMEPLYPYIRESLDTETARDLARNKQYLFSFPQFGLQVRPDGEMYEVLMEAQFDRFTERPIP